MHLTLVEDIDLHRVSSGVEFLGIQVERETTLKLYVEVENFSTNRVGHLDVRFAITPITLNLRKADIKLLVEGVGIAICRHALDSKEERHGCIAIVVKARNIGLIYTLLILRSVNLEN